MPVRSALLALCFLAACTRSPRVEVEPAASPDESAAAARDSTLRDTTVGDSTSRDSIAAPDSTVRDSAASDSAGTDSTVIADSLTTDSTAADTVAVRDSLAADSLSAKDSTATADSARADSAGSAEPALPPRPVGPVSVRVPEFRRASDSAHLARTVRAGLAHRGWPVKSPPPLPGSILPGKRIVAFYGSTLSKRMGILGQIPPDSMLAKLDSVATSWEHADPATPVQRALHFVTVVASADSGDDNKWRMRMDSATIEKVYGYARPKEAILFLDIQAGHSTIQDELPRLAKFLSRPDVHLGIDPEFYMKNLRTFQPPGKQVGVLTAAEINYAIAILAGIVEKYNLPPKVLVIHRFRQDMVRNAKDIKLDPRVQVVMHMDGWGVPSVKFSSYRAYVVAEPVQFTGFKLFFRHDTLKGDRLLQPMELVQLRPAPLYIQYQ